MTQTPVFPLWIDAYLADTTHLTCEQHGAYFLILLATWRNHGRPLPDDDQRMARVVRMTPARWRKLKPIIAEFFEIIDGKWHQKRLEKEWKNSQNYRQKMRENGKRGGRPKPLENNETTKPIGSSQVNLDTKPIESRSKALLVTSKGYVEDDLSTLVEDVPDGEDYPPIGPPQNSETKNGKRPGRKLEATWRPSPADVDYAAERGIDGRRLEDEIENFIEHFTNGNGRNKTSPNWSLRWQRWCRTADDYQATPGGGRNVGAGHQPATSNFLAGVTAFSNHRKRG